MGRPKVPLIDRDEAIAKALELIDRDGIEAFSIRKLGSALGVNGASLYHHFKDKDEILHGVRLLVLREARVFLPASKSATWQDYAAKSVTRYRAALLAHPNAAPLMTPGRMRPIGLTHRDHLVTKMLRDGVPPHYCYPIIDSVETLGFGSALFNPRQLPPGQRFAPLALDELPGLDLAVRSAFRTADRLFRLELRALLEGWTALIDREGRCVLSGGRPPASRARKPPVARLPGSARRVRLTKRGCRSSRPGHPVAVPRPRGSLCHLRRPDATGYGIYCISYCSVIHYEPPPAPRHAQEAGLMPAVKSPLRDADRLPARRAAPAEPLVEHSLRPRLTAIAPSVSEVVRSAGGWLFDQGLAGWDVSVLTTDHGDARPLRIIGASGHDLDIVLASPVDLGTCLHVIAAPTELYDSDKRVRRMVHNALEAGSAELRLWGRERPADLYPGVVPVRYRLSVAARAFKVHALSAAGVATEAVSDVEVFGIVRPRLLLRPATPVLERS